MRPEDREASRAEDAEMVRAVLAGDMLAFRGLVEKYEDRVYGMVLGMLRNREDARDVAQEAFVKAYRSLSTFRLEAGFYTWLYRIAMNLAIDHVRRKKRSGAVSSFDEAVAARDDMGEIAAAHHEDGPGRVVDRKELHGQILAALETLPEDQREVVLLREVDGLSYRDIADVMGVPEGTVMSRLFYARKKLQKALEAVGFGPVE